MPRCSLVHPHPATVARVSWKVEKDFSSGFPVGKQAGMTLEVFDVVEKKNRLVVVSSYLSVQEIGFSSSRMAMSFWTLLQEYPG